MKAVSYIPIKDQIRFIVENPKGKPSKSIGSFKIWWRKDGTINAIIIDSYNELVNEINENIGVTRLGGLMGDVQINENEIRKNRRELLKLVEKGL